MPCFGSNFCISLTSKGQSCQRGKNAKENITVLLCVWMVMMVMERCQSLLLKSLKTTLFYKQKKPSG